jgi:hypothetical protein
MRALAEYVMRGRRQALWVAALTAGIPMFFWVSAATVGLVTLRRGLSEGAFIAMWSLIPAGIVAYFGEIMPMAAVIGSLVTASVLRLTASWQWALCTAALVGLVFSAGLMTLGSDYLAALEKLAGEVVANIAQRPDADAAMVLEGPSAADIAGMFGLVNSVTLMICLVISRWWQAALYNPGGFRVEFHALRLGHWQSLVLILMAVLLGSMGPQFRFWAWLPLLPLLFAGLGLVHALAAARGGPGWLGLCYAALLLIPPFKHVLVVIAAIDGWVDFRRRWLTKPGGED